MKNSQKGFSIVPVIILVALLAIGGGLYWHAQKAKTEPVSSILPLEATPTIPETAIPAQATPTSSSLGNATPSATVATSSAEVKSTGTYTDWFFPSSASGYDNFSWDVTVNKDPSPQSYFYSTQFGFRKSDGTIGIPDTGGYFGIQTDANGKRAVFSLWNAITAQGPEFAGTFGGEGTGYSVRINYPWVAGRTYHLKIGRLDADADGQWWGAWIKDTVTQIESYVGKIKESSWMAKLYGVPTSWTEYYGINPSSCESFNLSDVSFSNVKSNDETLSSNGHNNHLASPVNCPSSSFIDTANGVRQIMGAQQSAN